MIRKGTRLAVVVAAMALVACLPQGDASQDGYAVGPGAAESDPSQVVTARAACEARGGEWRNAGISGLMTCFTTPRDAGKTCERSSDCETECLARSRSCSPVSPLLGCNDVLDASGTHGDPMRGLIRPKAIALLAALALAGCVGAPEATGTRDASVPMSSLAAFDAKAFAGRWYEVETYLPEGASCVIGAVTFSPQKSGDMTVTEGPCADGTPQRGFARRIGPGRFDFQGRELWVLWVDQEYEVAVIVTPEGRAHILSRRLGIRDDKRAAAREILAWNGFDVARLKPARRR